MSKVLFFFLNVNWGRLAFVVFCLVLDTSVSLKEANNGQGFIHFDVCCFNGNLLCCFGVLN